jgi:hypothetical protein
MPAGFFFSAAGKGVTAPNRFIVLLYAGVASLALGVVSLGIGSLIVRAVFLALGLASDPLVSRTAHAQVQHEIRS